MQRPTPENQSSQAPLEGHSPAAINDYDKWYFFYL